jgi:CO/xanthine dehydrogenase FAD-binding subunit
VRALNEDAADFSTLVRCTDRALSDIRASGSRVRIGAGVTMAMILANRELTLLHPAARSVGGPAVRAQATVGGNLFAPPPYGDFTAVLLALDARVSVHSGYSPRDVPVDEFLRDRDSHSRAVAAGVEFARPRDTASLRFVKVSKVRPKGVSLLTIAARLEDSAGRLSGVRVAYANMAPVPIRAVAVERALEGRRLERSAVDAAAAVATDGCSPPTDAIASAWYRREVLPVHLSRLFLGSA